MNLPKHTSVTPDALRAVAIRHGLPAAQITALPHGGIINAIYLLGEEHVLRIPRNHPFHVAHTHTEAVAVPAARAAGVRTPRLVVYDATCTLLPVPYTIIERVPGVTLAALDFEPAATPDLWRELGRDLALLHSCVTAVGPAATLRTESPLADPRHLAEQRAADGWFTALEVRWLTRWLDRIAPAATMPVPNRFLHLDLQTANIMVEPATARYTALIDWGNAGWGDSAWDCFGVPLRAVPFILEGHRSVAPLDADEAAETRILWRHLQMLLTVLPRGAVPGLSWAERPLAWLLELMRFFADAPEGRWRDLRP